MMELGNKVVLKTFNLTIKPDEDICDEENYWILIGKVGSIIQSPVEEGLYASFSKDKRLLVRFDDDLSKLGLSCHNEIENSLWILEEDLILDQKE